MSNFDEWWTFNMAPNRDGSGNDTTDDGAGPTHWGWTFPTFVSAMNHAGMGHKATPTTFAALTEDQAKNLAQSYFWDRFGGPQLKSGPDIMVVDWAWNSGEEAILEIQANMKFPMKDVDGIVGEETIAAINAISPADFISDCYSWRVAFFNASGYQKKFPGLYYRAAACKSLALTLITTTTKGTSSNA